MLQTPLAPASQNHRYYPYIDGLRAFAVLAVLIYHLNSVWLPGGFVGVDVFFVISGFVVSASIVNFKGHGLTQFLRYFYARRIKRIFPALVVCLLLTAYATALFIPSSWLSRVNQDTGLYAFFGLSNFILAQTGRDYFAPTTDFNPFTHTWSLAVEEQFYVIFPFLFLAWLGGRRGRWLSVMLFAGGLLLSVLFSGWQSLHHPTQAFFLSPGRFWELAAGVLLYQLLTLRPALGNFRFAAVLRTPFALLSLLALLASFFVSTPERFPMPGALLAVLGTTGLIFSLHDHPELQKTHRLLGNRALVLVGRISYSLYLWHWPVFVLFRWTCGLETPLQRVLAVVLAFALAIASYRFVEMPFRYAGIMRRIPQTAVIVCGLLFITSGWWTAERIFNNPGLSLSAVSRNPEVWYPHGTSTSPDHPGCVADPEHHNINGGLLTVYMPRGCLDPQPLNNYSIYVIGDSHALAYENMFKQYALRNATTIFSYNNGGCSFPPQNIDDGYCRRHADSALHDLRQRIKPGDVLFLPSLRLSRFSDQWAYFGDDAARGQMFSPYADTLRLNAGQYAVQSLGDFARQGVHIVFAAPTPLFRAPPFRCADTFNHTNPICRPGFEMPRELLETFRRPVLESFVRIGLQLPNMEVWDPFSILCPGEQCNAWHDGLPLFFDGDHLSGYGNTLLLQSFSAFMHDRLGQPESTTLAFELKNDIPDFIILVEGLSQQENWGRWSDAALADRIRLEFAENLPGFFTLEISAAAYGPNIGRPVKIIVDGIEKEAIFNEDQTVAYVTYEHGGNGRTIEIVPPQPVSPSALGNGDDPRKLGIGIAYIKIHSMKPGTP